MKRTAIFLMYLGTTCLVVAMIASACECSCTQMDCQAGLLIEFITDEPIAGEETKFDFVFSFEGLDETLEYQFFGPLPRRMPFLFFGGSDSHWEDGDEIVFYGLDVEHCDRVHVEIFKDDEPFFDETYEIVHSVEVCNECSGSRWCDDDTFVVSAPISINLP